MPLRPLCALLLLAACVARPTGDSDGATSEGSTDAPGTTSGTLPSGDGPPTTGGPGTTDPVVTTGGPTSTTGTGDGPDPGTSDNSTTTPFITPFDSGNHLECDIWTDDCAPGQKCMPWASDGGNVWNATKCVDVAPDPDGVGEPCKAVDSPVSGEDTCDKHMMCWDVDLDTLEGTCVAMCVGSLEAPACEDPQTSCKLSSDPVLIVCLPDCDPLLQDCGDGEVCVPDPMNLGKFLCALDAGGDEGQVFDPCEFGNVCDPGLFCDSPQNAGECDPAVIGCCLPFCDTTAANGCPGQGLECVPLFAPGEALPGLEHVGSCRLP